MASSPYSSPKDKPFHNLGVSHFLVIFNVYISNVHFQEPNIKKNLEYAFFHNIFLFILHPHPYSMIDVKMVFRCGFFYVPFSFFVPPFLITALMCLVDFFCSVPF